MNDQILVSNQTHQQTIIVDKQEQNAKKQRSFQTYQ